MKTRLLLALALACLFLPGAPARAGGFCSGGTGSETFSDETGVRVVMRDFCFAPTVLRIAPGETVTFENRDLTVHAVAGAAGTFGEPHKEIARNAKVSFTFSDEGVYPYYCTFHPGMVGAVVVGDGEGPVVAGSIQAAAPRREQPSGSGSELSLALPLGISLVLLTAALVAVVTLKRRSASAAA